MNEVIVYILKVLAIHGLLYLFYRLVLRNSGHHAFNRYYLLMAILFAFFIPLIELSLPEKVQSSNEITEIFWLSEPVSGMEEFELVPVEQQSGNSFWHLLPWCYVLIAFILLIRSVFYLLLLTRLKKQSEYVKKRWFKLFKISQERPFSFFSNVFMPKALFGTDAFEQILAHECEHVRQRHSIDRLLMDFVVSLFWFNPFIYMYRNALIEIHEFQADEVVLDKFKDPVGYQEILFSQLQSAQYSGLVSHFNFSMTKKRIVMMNKERKMSGWVYVLTVPITLMVVFAFSSKEAMEPINEVGDEIASIIGPENGLSWPELELQELNESKGYIQDNIPSISPIKDSDLVRLSSSFGMRTHPISKEKKMHKGIDFVCPIGTNVMATADGTVTGIEIKPEGYGKLVTITHDNGYKTRYAQLSEFKVKKGDEVKKGDVIALSGSSGMSTGPHLHYEVMLMDKHVDPLDFIKDYNFKATRKARTGLEEEERTLAEQEMMLAMKEREMEEKREMLREQEEMLALREKELAMREAQLREIEYEEKTLEEALYQEQLSEEEREMKIRIAEENFLSEYDRVVAKRDPLFIVDGEIVERVSELEPSDIESITVLKGKNADAIYGSRGKDGVILIKTKNKNKLKNKDKGKAKNKNKGKLKN